MLVTYESRKELSPGTWEYRFKPERPLDYISGQYVIFQILREFQDPRGSSRTFTLTSLPEDDSIAFAVQFPEPGSPYKHHLQHLEPGEKLRVTDAMGDVILPKDPATPLVFIAGGLGIASYVSILQSLLHKSENRTIDLFYGRRSIQDNPYDDLLDRVDFHSRTLKINPERVSTPEILASLNSGALVYISGSQKFTEGIRAELLNHGVAHERIVFDYYDGYVSL